MAPPPVPEQPRPWEAVPAGQIALIAAVTDGHTSTGARCTRGEPLPPTEPPAWGDLPLNSTWASGPARLGAPVCIKGWCDDDVVALPVVGGGTGALIRADATAPPLESLTRTASGDVPVADCGDAAESEEEGSPVEDCATWVAGDHAIQVHGRGVVQHNHLPLLEACEARVLGWEGDRWVAGPWAPLEGRFASLPVPLARSAEQVLWLADHEEVWLGTFNEAGWTVTQRVGGGIDAGCD